METIRHQDWLRLHEAVLAANEAPSLAKLPGAILAAMARLVDYDTATLQDDRGGLACIPWLHIEHEEWRAESPAGSGALGVRAMTDWENDFRRLRDAFFSCSGDRHPHTAYYRRTKDRTARRISDVVPMSQLQRTRFFNEISRPNQIKWQLTIYEPLPQGGTLLLAACRKRTDFSERDRILYDLFRPHAAQAWRRALAREAEQARRLQAAGGSPRPAASVGDDSAARVLLRKRFGLTEREAHVLVWLTQGKTNPEIGIILAMSLSTVKTHALRIFAKLGCETRTAVARMVLEAFGGFFDGSFGNTPSVRR